VFVKGEYKKVRKWEGGKVGRGESRKVGKWEGGKVGRWVRLRQGFDEIKKVRKWEGGAARES